MAERIIVLTGGIGSGKSAAAQMFEQLGISVIDADAISHELTSKSGPAMSAIARAFGPQVVDPSGALHRQRMRELAFGNSEVRQALEAILHPMIAAKASQALRAAQGPYAVYAVPLWLEKYGPGKPQPEISPHAIVVVDCDDETRIARVARRSGLSREQILAIMDTQASRQERLAAANVVLDNSTSLESLASQVARLHQELIGP